MRIGLTGFSALVAVVAVFWVAAVPGQGQGRQTPAGPAPAAGRQAAAAARPAPAAGRTEDGKPNLNGIWQAITTANWDIEANHADAGPHSEIMGAWGAEPGGMGIVEGGTIPYKPEALKKKQENLRNRLLVKAT